MHPSTTDSDELLRPATEQEALRRIATLVARAAPPAEIYEALTTEVGRLMPSGDANLLRFEGGGMATMIGRWNEFDGYLSIGARLPVGTGTLAQLISESGSPSRIASYTESTGPLADMIRGWGWRSSVGAPVIVDAKVWGLTAVGSRIDRELPAGTEHRLAAFTELLAHAIANAQSRAELEQLAREQAALRRVAELVARGVDHDELFASVATESSQLIDGHPAVLVRRGRPAGWTVVAARGGLSGVASRLVSGDDDGDAGVLACVSRTGRTARVDDLGVRSDVGVPIFLSTRLWGVLVITSRAGPLPGTVERRLEEFAGLITAALANAQARTEVEELAAEQAALLRVAERVARGDPPAAVFEAVAAEAQQLLGGQPITLVRFEEDDELVVVSHSGGLASPGARWRYAPRTLPDRVRRAGRPGRVDDYRLEPDADLAESLGTVAAVAAPVHVESRVWGMFTATSADGPLAAGVEDRLRGLSSRDARASDQARR
jgi:GAF domain-containing protein